MISVRMPVSNTLPTGSEFRHAFTINGVPGDDSLEAINNSGFAPEQILQVMSLVVTSNSVNGWNVEVILKVVK